MRDSSFLAIAQVLRAYVLGTQLPRLPLRPPRLVPPLQRRQAQPLPPLQLPVRVQLKEVQESVPWLFVVAA